ncbi:MAG: hypothetical protein Q4B99_04200 [Clostridia bacterium]|nr:hypothetical protein [Clostridia bacterium]
MGVGKKKLICVLALLFAVLFAASCTVPTLPTLPAAVYSGDSLDNELKLYYRNSKLIVAGYCVGTHVEQVDGVEHVCSDIMISIVLAGSETLGGIIHCPDLRLSGDGEYLFFLDEIDGELRLLTESPLRIVDERVIWEDGALIPLGEIQSAFRELANIVVVPSTVYFFQDLPSLIEYCDDIFYATVIELGQLDDKVIRIERRGVSLETNPTAMSATLQIDKVEKGSAASGTYVELLYGFDDEPVIIDHATMQQTYSGGLGTQLVIGNRYVFFTVRSSDGKQEELFMVNPYQGAVLITEGGALRAHRLNSAVSIQYERLEDLAKLFSLYE